MTVVRVALPVPRPEPFDYLAPDEPAIGPGQCVWVRLAGRRRLGVVVELPAVAAVPPERLQPIERVVEELPPLPGDILRLARFAADYYRHPLGLALQQVVPPRARRERPARPRRAAVRTPEDGDAGRRAGALLNAEQATAVEALVRASGSAASFLLHGVTGSGKTEVYLSAAEHTIATGGQVLLLVPEINLTPQLEARVRARLPRVEVATLHSGLAAGRRLAHWRAAGEGRAALVLGTRLAVFAPLPRLALIVVDEEHDASFKQQDGFRYHARDLALWRGRDARVPVVLGSATPSLETWARALDGHLRVLSLPSRAVPGARPPAIELVPSRGHASGLSPRLVEALRTRLERREQSLLFVNRRGFSPSLLCFACGWAAGCPRCSARLVVHLAARRLKCHHCGHEEAPPRACPGCGNQDLLPVGHGTQRLEATLAGLLPGARVLRVDRDSTQRRGAWTSMLAAIGRGEADVLVGTQMIAKGHDFPMLTLVGVLGADDALYSADFRATERLFAQLMQVAGRAGRARHPGEVIVQTDFPRHPVYAALLAQDYAALAGALLDERRVADLPPYTVLALLRAEAPAREAVERFLELAHRLGLEAARGDRRATRRGETGAVAINPPVPARMARRAGLERGQILAQARTRNAMRAFLRTWDARLGEAGERAVRWSIDVDPLELD